jgi:putative heme-binding domain-containing protein
VGKLVGGGEPEAIQLAALTLLQRFDRDEALDVLTRSYPQLRQRTKTRCAEVLLSRERWAQDFLARIDKGDWPAKDVAVELLQPLTAFQNKEIDALVKKHWGAVTGGTPEERLAEVRRLNNDLRAGSGNPAAGKALFTKHCASCHRLFNEGETIGPELTHANRKDRDYLLVSLVDPSAVVRKEYLSYVVTTTDGRTLTGLITAQDGNRLTLVNARNEKVEINRDRIDTLQESPVSLMPENLLKDLKPQELRDLFSYLQVDNR